MSEEKQKFGKMTGFLDFLEHKGKLASIIGFFIAFPVNLKATWDYFQGDGFTEQSLTALAVFNILGMVWFILPSKIIIEWLKGKFIIED